MDNHQLRPEVRQAIQSHHGSSIRYSHTIKKRMVYVARSIGEGPILRLAIPINYLDAERGTIVQQMGVYIMGIFFLCLALTLVTSRWISSPLKWAMDTLNRIHSRQFDGIQKKRSLVKEMDAFSTSLVTLSTH